MPAVFKSYLQIFITKNAEDIFVVGPFRNEQEASAWYYQLMVNAALQETRIRCLQVAEVGKEETLYPASMTPQKVLDARKRARTNEYYARSRK